MPGGLILYYVIFGLALVASLAAFIIVRSRGKQQDNDTTPEEVDV